MQSLFRNLQYILSGISKFIPVQLRRWTFRLSKYQIYLKDGTFFWPSVHRLPWLINSTSYQYSRLKTLLLKTSLCSRCGWMKFTTLRFLWTHLLLSIIYNIINLFEFQQFQTSLWKITPPIITKFNGRVGLAPPFFCRSERTEESQALSFRAKRSAVEKSINKRHCERSAAISTRNP